MLGDIRGGWKRDDWVITENGAVSLKQNLLNYVSHKKRVKIR